MKNRILIVEDEKIVALDLRLTLEDLGYEVVGSTGYAENALSIAVQTKPDLVLMDVQLKGDMRGTEAAQQLYQQLAMPVVFLSAYSDPQTLDDAELSLPFGYLIKPFETKELDATIRMALTRSNAEKQTKQSEQRLRMALEAADLGCWEWNSDDDQLVSMGIANVLLDLPPDVIHDGLDHFLSQIHADHRAQIAEQLKLQLDISAIVKLDRSEPLWVELYGRAFERQGQNVVVGVMRDITDEFKRRQELNQAHALFHTTSEGIMILNQHFEIVSCNPAFSKLTGFAADEVLGRNPEQFLHVPSSGSPQPMRLSDLKAQHWSGEVLYRRRDGRQFPAWQHVCRAPAVDGGPPEVHYVLTFSNISALRRAEQNLARMAYQDHLTGLGNRAKLEVCLREEVERARRGQSRLGVLYMDLDGFKLVNDTLGHNAGDRLLQTIAQRICANLRSVDIAIRVGGDEFVVLCPNQTEDFNYFRIADKLLKVIANDIELDDNIVSVSASIGIASFPEDASTPEKLMQCADLAMFAAKDQGRNRYAFYNPLMTKNTQQRVWLEKVIKEALSHEQFALHYQPIVHLASSKVYGVEALLRLQHPSSGWLDPEQMIHVAECSHLIVDLGAWIFRKACADYQALADSLGNQPVLSINVSIKQLEEDGFIEFIERTLAEFKLAPATIQIEVTETLLQRLDDCAERLAALRKLGLRIAIDDFGTGYSSLSRLRNLPIDNVKIDRSFVMNIPHNQQDLEITKAVCAMCHAMNVSITAEGVETDWQLSFLRKEHCQFGQGYLFAKPLALPALAQWQTQFDSASDSAAG